MAKPAKRRVSGGRVTAKKGTETTKSGPGASTRYTPPVPRELKSSPMWVPVLMFALLGIGMVLIFVNYLGVLPNGTSNVNLAIGLGAICGGIMVATQYR